jgi:hypothetical protein
MRFSSTLGLAACMALSALPVRADGVGTIEDGVAFATSKGITTSLSLIDPDFRTTVLATRTDALENPSGLITNYGMLRNGTLTEPDENLYLVLRNNPGGPDPHFDYGRRFLFQGHENGAPLAYITRINLDVPRGDSHRITLLTPVNPTTGTTGLARSTAQPIIPSPTSCSSRKKRVQPAGSFR